MSSCLACHWDRPESVFEVATFLDLCGSTPCDQPVHARNFCTSLRFSKVYVCLPSGRSVPCSLADRCSSQSAQLLARYCNVLQVKHHGCNLALFAEVTHRQTARCVTYVKKLCSLEATGRLLVSRGSFQAKGASLVRL